VSTAAVDAGCESRDDDEPTPTFTLAEAAMRIQTKRAARPPRRGAIARALLFAVLSALAAGAGTGCGTRDTDAGSPSRSAPGAGAETRGVTADGLVLYAAGLTVAVEDGLVGEAARQRAEELGAPRYERAQVEAFAARLRENPAEWVRIAARIDERVKAIREEEAPVSEAASRPSR
jgi:hypothetical protein